jgi:hypothetical protein
MVAPEGSPRPKPLKEGFAMDDRIDGRSGANIERQVRANIFGAGRITYIKPTGSAEAHRLGLIPEDVDLPEGTKLYVLHAVDGSVLGYTDGWDSAYGAALQNELTPVSVH